MSKHIHQALEVEHLLRRDSSALGLRKMQEPIKAILPRHRANTCLRRSSRGGLVRFEGGDGRVKKKGLFVCGLGHICPVCHEAKANLTRTQIAAYFDNDFDPQQDGVVYATLTIPHHSSEPLAELKSRLEKVWAEFKKAKRWNKLCSEIGVKGYFRRFEVVITEGGWHPHIHLMLVCDRGAIESKGAAASCSYFAELWRSAAMEAKTRVTTKAQDVQYLVDVGSIKTRAHYCLKSMSSCKPGSLTPLDLLRIVDQAPNPQAVNAAKQLFIEYTRAIKNVHACTTGGCMKKENTTDSRPEDSEPEPDWVVMLSFSAWKAVVKHGGRVATLLAKEPHEILEWAVRAAWLEGYIDPPEGWCGYVSKTKNVIHHEPTPALT